MGKCRDNREICEQCMNTSLEDIYSIHYSPCGNPWNCMTKERIGDVKEFKVAIGLVDFDHCSKLYRQWHELRSDLENELLSKIADESLKNIANGATP